MCGVREHLAVGQAGVDKFWQLLANLVLLLFLDFAVSLCLHVRMLTMKSCFGRLCSRLERSRCTALRSLSLFALGGVKLYLITEALVFTG